MRATQFIVLMGLVAALPAMGDVIYSNGSPNNTVVWASDFDVGGAQIFQGESFVLEQGASTVTDIHWYGGYAYSNEVPEFDDFFVDILLDGQAVYSENVGHVTRTNTGQVGLDGVVIWEYSLYIQPLELQAGSTYWLTIVNSTPETDSFWGWSVASNGIHGQLAEGVFTLEDHELAFDVTDDLIPEPATMSLLGLGLLAMFIRYRKVQGRL